MRTKKEILEDIKDAINIPGTSGDKILRLRELEVQIDIRDELTEVVRQLIARS